MVWWCEEVSGRMVWTRGVEMVGLERRRMRMGRMGFAVVEAAGILLLLVERVRRTRNRHPPMSLLVLGRVRLVLGRECLVVRLA